MQELLEQLQHELLATTRLPMAIDFLLTELKHSGLMAPAMARLSHYFHPFQTYLITSRKTKRASSASKRPCRSCTVMPSFGPIRFGPTRFAPTRSGPIH